MRGWIAVVLLVAVVATCEGGDLYEDDVRALQDLDRAFGHPRHLPKWGTDEYCSWYGVGCNAEETRVTSLLLNVDPNQIVDGTLPGSVSRLTALTRLNLSGHNVGGTIPDSIGLMSQLQELYLGDCTFIGQVPASLGKLSALTELDLSNNYIAGTIPPQIADLHNLLGLKLNDNEEMTGTIPPGLQKLTRLVALDLSHNRFYGAIPPFIARGAFRHLNLEGNYWWCPYPDHFVHKDNGLDGQDCIECDRVLECPGQQVFSLAKCLCEAPHLGITRNQLIAVVVVSALLMVLLGVCLWKARRGLYQAEKGDSDSGEEDALLGWEQGGGAGGGADVPLRPLRSAAAVEEWASDSSA